MKKKTTVTWILLLLAFKATPDTMKMKSEKEIETIEIILPANASDETRKIAGLLLRQIEKRSAVRATTDGNATCTVFLAVDPVIGAEGFRLSSRENNAVEIAGGDIRGLLFGAGKFLHDSQFTEKGMIPGVWRGESRPLKPLRGIYFATHFHNYYQEAPIEETTEYIGELGLWGVNTLSVWYDCHHFSNFEDPDATKFRKRLYSMLATASSLGMEINITLIVNEGYTDAPINIRADISKGMRGGVYDTQICTSNPEGKKYVLEHFAKYFMDMTKHGITPAGIWLWGYDQGGCGCPKCMPPNKTWGEAGFLKIAPELAAVAKKFFPEVTIYLSLWMFKQQETGEIVRLSQEKKRWFDRLIVDHAWTLDGTPAVEVVNFPEISMFNSFPWGGFGATVLSKYCQERWNWSKKSIMGGFPYSEGIFDDINKVIHSRFYWDDSTAARALEEYFAFEFGKQFVPELMKVAGILERNHHYRWWPDMLKGRIIAQNWFPCRGAEAQADAGAEEAYQAVKKINAAMTSRAAASWRWRQLYLRTLLDAELKMNGGTPNEKCEAAFAELIQLYHAQNADTVVRPPKAKD